MNTTKTDEDKSIMVQLTEAYGDEDRARRLLERLRWPSGVICPHCQNAGEKRISPLAARAGSSHACARASIFAGPVGGNSP